MKYSKTIRTGAFLVASALSSGFSHAADFTASTWNPGPHPNAAIGYTEWAKTVKEYTNGTVNFEVYTDGALLPPRTTMQGVRDNVTQAGFVYPPYTPAEQPRASMLVDLMFVSTDSLIAELAWAETNFNDASMQGEWKKNGGVFGGGYTTPVYNFICAKGVGSLDALKGAKVRTGSVAQTSWANYLGAVPVSVPFPDVYSGLQRGSIDCVIGGPENLGTGYKLAEVAKNVTTLPMGVVAGAMWVYNPTFWKALTAEERRGILRASARSSVRALDGMEGLAKSGIQATKDRNIPVEEPSAELVAKLAEFKKTFIGDLEVKGKSNGIDNAGELIQKYLAAEQKWTELLSKVDRTDQEAVIKLVDDELFAKIDAGSYGLN